jgi:hypothetical protein
MAIKKYINYLSVSIIITIILAGLFRFNHYFSFFTEQYLGRCILLLLLAFIAATNKILGLITVLGIILAYNWHDIDVVKSYNYYEGFDISGNTLDISGNNLQTLQTDLSGNNLQTLQTVQNIKMAQNIKTAQNIKMAQNIQDAKATVNSTMDSSNNSLEGFCMSDRELNILRGKKSNEVTSQKRSSNYSNNTIDPYDNSELYSAF